MFLETEFCFAIPRGPDLAPSLQGSASLDYNIIWLPDVPNRSTSSRPQIPISHPYRTALHGGNEIGAVTSMRNDFAVFHELRFQVFEMYSRICHGPGKVLADANNSFGDFSNFGRLFRRASCSCGLVVAGRERWRGWTDKVEVSNWSYNFVKCRKSGSNVFGNEKCGINLFGSLRQRPRTFVR